MRLRPAAPDDAAALCRIVQAGFEGYRPFAPPGWEPPPQDDDEHVGRLRAELEADTTFCRVAEVEGTIAGHVTLVPARSPSADGSLPDLHLRHLFVLEPYWGTGVARALHAAMLAEVHGTARLFTPARHGRARRFYEREGWTLHHGPYADAAIGMDLVEYRLRRDVTPGGAEPAPGGAPAPRHRSR